MREPWPTTCSGPNPLSTINNQGSQPTLSQICRKSACYLQWQSWKLNSTSVTTGPNGQDLISTASPSFVPTPNLGPTAESQSCMSDQSHKMHSFLLPSLHFHCTNNLPLSLFSHASDGDWLPCYSKLRINSLCLLIWLVFIYFHSRI